MPRLDQYLYENGFCRSRSLGAKLIRAGYVFVDGRECTKPSETVLDSAKVEIRENPLTRYVSRGGLKLEAALSEFEISPKGLWCIDVGASTGGFTDCLLQNGAMRVYAVDSGTDQLHPSLKENDCVVSLENVNARFLDESMVPVCPLVVMDVSLTPNASPEFIARTLSGTTFDIHRKHTEGNSTNNNLYNLDDF